MEPYSYNPYQMPYCSPDRDPTYRRQERRNLGRIGWALTVYLLVTTLLTLAVYFVCYTFFPTVTQFRLFKLLTNIVPNYVIGFPIFAGMLIGMPKKTPKKDSLGLHGWITFLAIAFFLMMSGNYIANALMNALETLKGAEIPNAIDQVITRSAPWENFILIVLCAPIVEELMCRKLIIDRLLPYSEWLAVLISGLFFGLLHGNFYQFFYATFTGILFSIVYVKTGNILNTIIMHMVINFSGSIVSMASTEILSSTDYSRLSLLLKTMVEIYYLAMFVLAVCGGILTFLSFKNIALKKSGSRWLPMKSQFFLLFCSFGTIVYLVISLLSFIGSL